MTVDPGSRPKTTVRPLWDDRNYRDDAVELVINPKPSQTGQYYGMEMNARAVPFDYFYIFPTLLLKRMDFSGAQLCTHLRGSLNVRDDKDEGWTLEVAIPWKNFEELAPKLPPEPVVQVRDEGFEPPSAFAFWPVNIRQVVEFEYDQ